VPEPAPNAQLLRSLGRLVRGLSALFWGLPVALVVCFHTATADAMRSFGILPPVAATGLLVYGLWQLGDFQKQERVWRNAVDRARLLSLINFGLSPFLYWWKRMPTNGFFLTMVVLMAVFGWVFLASINLVLQRLGAILPDETLRLEIKHFTVLNLNLLAATLVLAGLYFGVGQLPSIPAWLAMAAQVKENGNLPFWWELVLVLFMLVPLAVTMALLWKTKEVILDSIFRPGE